MKNKVLLAIAFVLAAASHAFAAAGSLVDTYNETRTVRKVTLAWTSDATGAVNGNLTKNISGEIYRVGFIPGGGGTQPTDLYDVVILDSDGLDILGGKGLDLSNANKSQIVEFSTKWTTLSSPAAGSQSTASKGAVTGVRHVADCVTFSGGAVAAPAATALSVDLRDGATGAGTVIWQARVAVPASAGYIVPAFSQCGLRLVGTANTAMTLEWSAGLANLSESVSISGYDSDGTATANRLAIDGTLELQVSNAGNAKTGTVVIYLR